MTLKSQPEKTKGSSILWIDDDHDIFRYTLPIFKKKGFSIVECLSGEEGIKELDENNQQYSLILLDLDMPGIDGIITFERIISINPRIPIVIVSAYSNQPTWRQRLELFRKIGITIEQVGKPFPPVGTEEFEEIIALFKRLQSEYLGKKTLDPFNYTFDEFRKLSHEERNHCTSIASKLNYTLVNDYLEDNPDVDWIVIAKYPGNVIKSGKTEDEPFDEDLEKWAEELDGPVFTYSRPETIFKLDTGTPSGITNTGWHMRNDSKGFFPTVCLKFESEFAGKFDFDTGSVNSYLLLENAKIMRIANEGLFPREGHINGEKYFYYKKRVNCTLSGKTNEINVQLTFHAIVQDEYSEIPSILHKTNRIGLIGVNFLTDNRIVLLLDGETKETDIMLKPLERISI